MTGTEQIATPRLSLDPLTVGDAPEMVDVLADPVLYEFTGGGPPSLAQLTERYRRQTSIGPGIGHATWHNWIVRRHGISAAVGFVQATVEGRTADIAWVIGTPWQGNGYASEAASALIGWLRGQGLEKITAHIHPEHGASAAVARNAGMLPSPQVEGGETVWQTRGQE